MLADSIVRAARHSFGEQGWAGTTLRGVARAAGVDPALVHYYFSSKEELLGAAMTPPPEWILSVADSVQAPIDRRGEAIIRAMLRAWSTPDIADALRSIVLTAAHVPAARERLRFVVTTALVGAVAAQLDDDERVERASLVASHIIGVALVRSVWKVEPLATIDDDHLVALLAPTIQRYLVEPLPISGVRSADITDGGNA
ncbi:MAG: TetR family transcriptional regulator [Acidimicrobiia bacterium]